MFRRVEDFKEIWKAEAAKTATLFAAIPDASLDQAVNPEHRDLRRMAWHLVESVAEMPALAGITLPDLPLVDGHLGDPPAEMAAILAAYTKAAEGVLDHIGAWNNAELGRSFDCYGEKWSGGFLLWVLVTHQTHHRGQMTVLMRQAGLKVPDVYGPAKEGWAAFGAQPPAV